VEGATQRGRFDEEMINEELPPYVDGNDRWGISQVWNRHRVTRYFAIVRRPFFRQQDAVVEASIDAHRTITLR